MSLSTSQWACGNRNLFGTNRTKKWVRNWKSEGRVSTVWVWTVWVCGYLPQPPTSPDFLPSLEVVRSNIDSVGIDSVGMESVGMDSVGMWVSTPVPHVSHHLYKQLIISRNKSSSLVFSETKSKQLIISAQEWTNRTPISHEPLICSKMCFTRTESVQ